MLMVLKTQNTFAFNTCALIQILVEGFESLLVADGGLRVGPS